MSVIGSPSERIASRCICCGGKDLLKSPAVLMPFVAKRVFDWDVVEITEDWGMRTLKTGMAYPLCNSLQCVSCRALFLDIRFSEEEAARLYSGYRNEHYTALRETFERGYAERNALFFQRAPYIPSIEAFLEPHLPEGPLHILDWGGDIGVNTPFRDKADKVAVYDISGRSIVDGAKSIGLEQTPSEAFNLIICSNVLEHVAAPTEMLNDISKQMAKDAILYIEVPYEPLMMDNTDLENLAQHKKHWHEHINFFSDTALRVMMKDCGLEVIEMEQVECDVYGRTGTQFFITCQRHKK
jgi:hypothetical protein